MIQKYCIASLYVLDLALVREMRMCDMYCPSTISWKISRLMNVHTNEHDGEFVYIYDEFWAVELSNIFFYCSFK